MTDSERMHAALVEIAEEVDLCREGGRLIAPKTIAKVLRRLGISTYLETFPPPPPPRLPGKGYCPAAGCTQPWDHTGAHG